MTEKILVFFALAAVGYYVRRRGIIGSAGVRDMILLNIDVCLPALSFTATAANLTPEVAALERGFAGPLLGFPLAAAVTCLAGFLLGRLTASFAGLKGKSARTYAYLLTFANAAFLPFPVSYALHGDKGALYVSLYLLGYHPLFWTVGMWIIGGRWNLRLAVHPILIGVVSGAIVGMTGIHVPAAIMETLQMVGKGGLALALLYSGAVLAENTISPAGSVRPLAWVTSLKLVAMPGIALLVVRGLAIPDPIGVQIVLQAAMPCMAQAGLYAARFGGDSALASKAAFLTTALCVLTVPFLVGLAGR